MPDSPNQLAHFLSLHVVYYHYWICQSVEKCLSSPLNLSDAFLDLIIIMLNYKTMSCFALHLFLSFFFLTSHVKTAFFGSHVQQWEEPKKALHAVTDICQNAVRSLLVQTADNCNYELLGCVCSTRNLHWTVTLTSYYSILSRLGIPWVLSPIFPILSGSVGPVHSPVKSRYCSKCRKDNERQLAELSYQLPANRSAL